MLLPMYLSPYFEKKTFLEIECPEYFNSKPVRVRVPFTSKRSNFVMIVYA